MRRPAVDRGSFIHVVSAIAESSVSVSFAVPEAPNERPPRELPPAVSVSVTGALAGSGHSVYGVGLLYDDWPVWAWQKIVTVVPPATFWPAVVATALASVMCVASGMSVITRVVVL